jgi:hypothetical protein
MPGKRNDYTNRSVYNCAPAAPNMASSGKLRKKNFYFPFSGGGAVVERR